MVLRRACWPDLNWMLPAIVCNWQRVQNSAGVSNKEPYQQLTFDSDTAWPDGLYRFQIDSCMERPACYSGKCEQGRRYSFFVYCYYLTNAQAINTQVLSGNDVPHPAARSTAVMERNRQRITATLAARANLTRLGTATTDRPRAFFRARIRRHALRSCRPVFLRLKRFTTTRCTGCSVFVTVPANDSSLGPYCPVGKTRHDVEVEIRRSYIDSEILSPAGQFEGLL